MGSEIQFISDGEGLAVIGEPAEVERFLHSNRLPSKDLGLPRLNTILNASSGVTRAGSEIAGNSGRWVQITKESAQKINEFGLMKGSSSGLSRGVVQAKGGEIKGIVEFATSGPGSFLANPAILAGAAGLMAQVAMKQSMDEITDYLATIDEKIDDVLRAQKDAVVADMVGAGFALDEAMTLRDGVGRVSEVTWSKVQTTSMTVARTQAYALRQLDALAEKLESKANMGDLAKTAKMAESKVFEWLAILARCVQLMDAFTVLELDRVLDASAEELDRHRIALKAARHKRLELIARSTEALMARLDAAAGTANTKVLMHPMSSRAVVASSNQVAGGVVEFQGRLGLEISRDSLEARRWMEAATEVRDNVLESGADGIDAAKRFSGETVDRARTMTDKITNKIAERTRRQRGEQEEN
ncbi:MAG: hypothetical protein IT190_02150 [Microbacteriaceae bacterium]|nr:hypothetical protein [Microbacteriaceae bacterium]